jgi:Ni,Fe-hydrogenase III large subunit
MAANNPGQAKIVTEYLEQFPTMPTRTLARVIYKAHPEAFKNAEAARGRVRYFRGEKGNQARGKLKDKTYMEVEKNRNYNLPKPDYVVREDFVLPANANNVLLGKVR